MADQPTRTKSESAVRRLVPASPATSCSVVCMACGLPGGSPPIVLCAACRARMRDVEEDKEPCCDNCGKPVYDWSDYGCERCDARVRSGEHLT